jgi:hypothetical protein
LLFADTSGVFETVDGFNLRKFVFHVSHGLVLDNVRRASKVSSVIGIVVLMWVRGEGRGIRIWWLNMEGPMRTRVACHYCYLS